MNTDDLENNGSSDDEKPKSPSELGKSLAETLGPNRKLDTRDLPGRVKIQGAKNIVDVTDRYIGKSFIFVGGSFSKPNGPAKPEEKKQTPKEENDGRED